MTVLEIKAAVRERDGNSCTKCGMHNAEHLMQFGFSLDVHRTTPGSEYSLEEGVCVTLCRPCHGPEPRRPHGSVERTHRMVRIRPAIAAVVHELCETYCYTFNEFVNEALRMRLEKEGCFAKPPSA